MQMLIGPPDAENFSMRRFTIAPGGHMPVHTNAVEHEQYVLNGSATIGIGDEVYQVGPGTSVYIPAGESHWYRTDGDEDFVFLCVVPNRKDKIEIQKKA